MRLQIDRDKRLPQFYIAGFVTDAEFQRIEQEVNPCELFKGLNAAQVLAASVAGMVYGLILRDSEIEQAKNGKRIEVVS